MLRYTLWLGLLLCGCQHSIQHPFSEGRLNKARAHQDQLQHFQTHVRDFTLERLRDAIPKVTTMNWMTFQPLRQGALHAGVQRIDMTANVFQFPFGKSWYKAFHLPEYEHDYRIVVESYAKNGMSEGTIFYPVFVFLDYAFKVTRIIVPNMLDNDPLLMHLHGEIEMKDAEKKEAYVIVATSEALLTSSTSMLSMESTIFRDPYSVYSDTGIPKMQYVVHERAHSPAGTIKIFWQSIPGDAKK